MSTNKLEYKQFSERLLLALSHIGLPDCGPTELSRNFNLRFGEPITVHAARKWIVGEAIPTQDKLRVLSDWLGVSPNWLRFGEHEEASKKTPGTAFNSRDLNTIHNLSKLNPADRNLVETVIAHMLRRNA